MMKKIMQKFQKDFQKERCLIIMATQPFTVSQAELEKRGKLLKKNTKIQRFIDLNTDIGQTRDLAFWQTPESEQFLSALSSVNLPCFVHDGLPDQVLELAIKAKGYGCALGAHIAFPDPVSMGYEKLPLSSRQLEHWILVQLGAISAILKPESLKIEHVRPHGALYHAMAETPEIAQAVANAVAKFDVWLPIVAPFGAYLNGLEKEHNSVVAPELILGKRYTSGGLESPKQYQEWLSPSATLEQARLLIASNELVAQNGITLPCEFKTLHISPVMPNAVELAETLAEELGQAIPLNVASVGESGWLLEYDDRQDVFPYCPYEDY